VNTPIKIKKARCKPTPRIANDAKIIRNAPHLPARKVSRKVEQQRRPLVCIRILPHPRQNVKRKLKTIYFVNSHLKIHRVRGGGTLYGKEKAVELSPGRILRKGEAYAGQRKEKQAPDLWRSGGNPGMPGSWDAIQDHRAAHWQRPDDGVKGGQRHLSSQSLERKAFDRAGNPLPPEPCPRHLKAPFCCNPCEKSTANASAKSSTARKTTRCSPF
jgi:hypothetical protein